MSVLIIAEAGVNHNGSLALAKEMARVAKEAGVDIVKYQTAVPELVVS
ncbi:MAG: N-acetylneuraminate synthase, partial [Ruthenibacterium sp.]